MSAPAPRALGDLVREARVKRKWSQEMLASALSSRLRCPITRSAVAMWETHRAMPSELVWDVLAEVFGLRTQPPGFWDHHGPLLAAALHKINDLSVMSRECGAVAILTATQALDALYKDKAP